MYIYTKNPINTVEERILDTTTGLFYEFTSAHFDTGKGRRLPDTLRLSAVGHTDGVYYYDEAAVRTWKVLFDTLIYQPMEDAEHQLTILLETLKAAYPGAWLELYTDGSGSVWTAAKGKVADFDELSGLRDAFAVARETFLGVG